MHLALAGKCFVLIAIMISTGLLLCLTSRQELASASNDMHSPPVFQCCAITKAATSRQVLLLQFLAQLLGLTIHTQRLPQQWYPWYLQIYLRSAYLRDDLQSSCSSEQTHAVASQTTAAVQHRIAGTLQQFTYLPASLHSAFFSGSTAG